MIFNDKMLNSALCRCSTMSNSSFSARFSGASSILTLLHFTGTHCWASPCSHTEPPNPGCTCPPGSAWMSSLPLPHLTLLPCCAHLAQSLLILQPYNLIFDYFLFFFLQFLNLYTFFFFSFFKLVYILWSVHRKNSINISSMTD